MLTLHTHRPDATCRRANTPRHRSRAVFAIALAILFPCGASGQDSSGYTRERLLQVAHEIIEGANYGALITMDADGNPRVRVMDPFPPEGEMTIWFATNPNTRKVQEIRENPKVSVYYFYAEALGYVTISGVARLVEDPAEKARHWKEEWESFYPNREEAYLLIAVTPDWLEVVSVGHGINGPDENWRPPRVEFEGGL